MFSEKRIIIDHIAKHKIEEKDLRGNELKNQFIDILVKYIICPNEYI